MADNESGGKAPDVGLIEKAFLMGLGTAVFARDKAEQLAGEMVKKGQMTKEESDSFVGKVAVKADETSAAVQKTVAVETEKNVKRMGLVTKADLAGLQDELTEIKAMLASLRPTEASGEK